MSVRFFTGINMLGIGGRKVRLEWGGDKWERFLSGELMLCSNPVLLRMKGVIGEHFNRVFQDPKLSEP